MFRAVLPMRTGADVPGGVLFGQICTTSLKLFPYSDHVAIVFFIGAFSNLGDHAPAHRRSQGARREDAAGECEEQVSPLRCMIRSSVSYK